MTSRSFHRSELKNGLTVLAEISPSAQSAAIGFFVKTGSRDETQKESGVSHFLEHMMFKGTPKRDALQLTYALGNIGAQANAFTTEENTAYYASVLPEYFDSMQEILSDMLRPTLDQKEFDTEKKVILEEIALYQDKPHFYLYERALADYFGAHPGGNSVLGSTESIAALTRDEMANYFGRRYSPGNVVLVGTGAIEWKKFLALAETYCGAWTSHQAPRTLGRCAPRTINKIYSKKDLKQSHVLLFSEGPSAQEDERYAMTILAMILGDSSGSKIYWDLVDSGLAESAGADTDERDGTGCFVASASTEPERLEEVTQRLRAIIAKPLDFSDDDLNRAKNKLAAKIVLGGELPLGRLMAIGSEWNYRGQVTPLREIADRVARVTREQVQSALAKYPLSTVAEFRLVPS